MNNLMNMARKAMAIAAFLTVAVAADAAEVVYRIVEYNKQPTSTVWTSRTISTQLPCPRRLT